MAMGTEGMKYSLISREVIADCIETCVQGQWMDGVLVIGGCDKNMPGGMMALARANVPGIYVYGGTIKRSEEHTSELQSLMRISYAVFCLKKKKKNKSNK